MAEFPIHGRFLFSILLRHRIRENGGETSGYAVQTRLMDIYGEEGLVTKSLSDEAQQIRGEVIDTWRRTKVARDFDIEIVSHSLTKLSDL